MIFAYIDPGAGSMALQAVLAAALAIPFFLRHHISSAVDRLRGRNAKTEQETPQNDD
jgi:hypothetical protein